MQVESYETAVTMIVRTPDMIEAEMENPQKANHSQFNYIMPNGVVCGVGKSQRPGHASLFQIIVTDFDGKPAFKFETEYAGEYTSSARAEKHLRQYCREAWVHAEELKAKAKRAEEAAKELKAQLKAEAKLKLEAEAEAKAEHEAEVAAAEAEEKARIDALAVEVAAMPDVAEDEDDADAVEHPVDWKDGLTDDEIQEELRIGKENDVLSPEEEVILDASTSGN